MENGSFSIKFFCIEHNKMGLKKEDTVGFCLCCFFLFRVLLGLEHLASLIKDNSRDQP